MQEKKQQFRTIKFPSWDRNYSGVANRAFRCVEAWITPRWEVSLSDLNRTLLACEKAFQFMDDVIFAHAVCDAAGMRADLSDLAEDIVGVLSLLLDVIELGRRCKHLRLESDVAFAFANLYSELLYQHNDLVATTVFFQKCERRLLFLHNQQRRT